MRGKGITWAGMGSFVAKGRLGSRSDLGRGFPPGHPLAKHRPVWQDLLSVRYGQS